jgi:hypothetical protein
MYYDTQIDYTIQGRVNGETFKVKAHKLREHGQRSDALRVEVIRGGRAVLVGNFNGDPLTAMKHAFEDVFGEEL